MAQLDTYAERLRVQLPAAPENILDGYVRFAPWVIMFFGVIALLGLLMVFGLAAALYPVYAVFGGYAYGSSVLGEVVLSLALTCLNIAGGYMMWKGRMTGWWLVAAALVVYMLQSLLSAALLGLIVSLLVAYLHVQVKPRYS